MDRPLDSGANRRDRCPGETAVITNDRRFPVRLDLKNGTVDMSHGSGGRAMAQLIAEIFHKYLDNDLLAQGNDQALYASRILELWTLQGAVGSADGHGLT